MATYDSLPVVPVGKNGASMPLIGFGTCCRKSSTGALLIRSTLDFLAAGGRLIDTAEMYGNHKDHGMTYNYKLLKHGINNHFGMLY